MQDSSRHQRPPAPRSARPGPGRRARFGVLRSNRRRSRAAGGVLVEFAFVSLAFYFLFAGTLELGRLLHASQILQDAARVGARELAVTPLAATADFQSALASPLVRQSIYDPACLALDVTGLDGATYRDFVDGLPLVNRLLAPLMVRERVASGGGAELDLLRYPGALFPDPDFDPSTAPVRATGWTVRLPRVVSRDAEGVETIEWVDVVEEVGAGSFSLSAPGPNRGLVALRLHYPFQAATLVASTPGGTGLGAALRANDAAVTTTGGATPLDVGGPESGANAGPYGLGVLQALGGQRVRPFRRFLSAQSVFRREVFL